jgi:hypothetical protein
MKMSTGVYQTCIGRDGEITQIRQNSDGSFRATMHFPATEATELNDAMPESNETVTFNSNDRYLYSLEIKYSGGYKSQYTFVTKDFEQSFAEFDQIQKEKRRKALEGSRGQIQINAEDDIPEDLVTSMLETFYENTVISASDFVTDDSKYDPGHIKPKTGTTYGECFEAADTCVVEVYNSKYDGYRISVLMASNGEISYRSSISFIVGTDGINHSYHPDSAWLAGDMGEMCISSDGRYGKKDLLVQYNVTDYLEKQLYIITYMKTVLFVAAPDLFTFE